VNSEWTQSLILKHVSMMQYSAVAEIQTHYSYILPLKMLSHFNNMFGPYIINRV
jgi:hypothetical protein